MLLRIRHGLLGISDYPNSKSSAIIINNDIIITSGWILQSYIRPTLPFVEDVTNENVCTSTKIIHKLQQCKLINIQDQNSNEGKYLNSLNYQVTFDERKLPINVSDRQRQRQPHILTQYGAKLLYLFCNSEISRNLHKFLNSHDSPPDHNEILLSSFLILSFKRETNETAKLQKFIHHIRYYLRYNQPIATLDDVLVMCTPFGLEHFYKTISIGKISNVMARDGCLFVLSNALPLGCEGSAVFNNKLHLIGMILCTSFQRQKENVNLTLTGNFAHILRDFMKQLGMKVTEISIPKVPSNFPWERAMVVIEAENLQGTGTFVKILGKKFILTCSHVVFNVNSKAYCRGVDGEFESDVLWRNPEYNQPFDVALLKAPSDIPDQYFVRLANSKPILGQTVYNAGFPYSVNFNLKYDFNPSIFQGRIIKYTTGAIISDGSVQAGQSGGPMFDQNGCILGICVSNIKVDKVIYPNINTAVPICEIRHILEQYAQTDDVRVLNNLVAKKEIQQVWALETPRILSKL